MPEPYRPRWAELLIEAVNRPGLILEAYSWFHKFSFGNQIAALMQCRERGIEPGPIASFNRWLALGRRVRRGERAITLCMPVTIVDEHEADDLGEPSTLSRKRIFVWRPHWFVLSQTTGEDYTPEPCPDWEKERALSALGVNLVPFTALDGNMQGYTSGTKIAINPLAKLPSKTLFHELGHVLLHAAPSEAGDERHIPRSLREVEAEAVALLCCDVLRLDCSDYCRGYIQEWLGKEGPIPERSAARIFKAADSVLKAGSSPRTEEGDLVS